MGCDREKGKQSLPQGQIGFIKFVVVPLFNNIGKILTDCDEATDGLEETKTFWEQQLKQGAVRRWRLAMTFGFQCLQSPAGAARSGCPHHDHAQYDSLQPPDRFHPTHHSTWRKLISAVSSLLHHPLLNVEQYGKEPEVRNR